MNDLESKTGYRFLSTHPIYRKNGRVFARVEKISPPRKLGVIELPEKSLESIYKLLQDTNGHVYQHIFEDVDSKSRIVWDETSVDDHWPAWARVNLVSFHKDGNWSVVDPKNNIVFLYDTNIEVFDKFASLTHTFSNSAFVDLANFIETAAPIENDAISGVVALLRIMGVQ